MKTLCTFIISLLILCGCQGNQPQTSSAITEGEVIITGIIKNRDFYPHVEELVLQLPFFRKGQTSYTTPIAEDCTFHFNFQLHAEMCEVAIKPYMEHLYVQPGDSLHLEIDFKDILNPIITGSGAELNKQITQFTEGGFYMQDYRIWEDYQTQEEFDRLMEKEHKERTNRYKEYVQKHQPTETVQQYIGEMLEADYYKALYDELNQCYIHRIKDVDISLYEEKLREAAQLLDNRVITDAHFRLAEEMYSYLHLTHKGIQANDRTTTLEDVLSPLKNTPAMPYLFARGLSSSLQEQNDTTYFGTQKEKFDAYIRSPYLRNSILQLQQSKKSFQENPKPVSDYILYGRYQDQVKDQPFLPHMKPIYQLLEQHRGKMIYLDFWAPWCPPCLAEMKPLKELRKRYSTKDIVFITICRNSNRERYEEVLKKYEMHQPGIEHINTNDWKEKDEIYKTYNQMNVNAFPYYYIINREGIIVNYGSMMRPSYPGTAVCIDQWLEQKAIN